MTNSIVGCSLMQGLLWVAIVLERLTEEAMGEEHETGGCGWKAIGSYICVQSYYAEISKVLDD